MTHVTHPIFVTHDPWPIDPFPALRRRLRSVDSPTLLVPSTRRSTLGDRAFPVAACRTGVEQSAATGQGRLLNTDIPTRD